MTILFRDWRNSFCKFKQSFTLYNTTRIKVSSVELQKSLADFNKIHELVLRKHPNNSSIPVVTQKPLIFKRSLSFSAKTFPKKFK